MQNVRAVTRQHGDPSYIDLAGDRKTGVSWFPLVLQRKCSDSHDHQILKGYRYNRYHTCNVNSLVATVPY